MGDAGWGTRDGRGRARGTHVAGLIAAVAADVSAALFTMQGAMPVGQPDLTPYDQQNNPQLSGTPNAQNVEGAPNEHISPQQRAGELIYYLQQAQQECRADANRVEDRNASRLFEEIAGILDQPLQALYRFQSGDESARVSG